MLGVLDHDDCSSLEIFAGRLEDATEASDEVRRARVAEAEENDARRRASRERDDLSEVEVEREHGSAGVPDPVAPDIGVDHAWTRPRLTTQLGTAMGAGG